jgi:hypothetical protein
LVDLLLQQRQILRAQERAMPALEERVKELEEALRQSGGGGGAAPFRLEPHRCKREPKRPGRE